MPEGAPLLFRRAALGLAALLALLPFTARAGTLEYPIKAAFLYKFAPFIQWPSLPPSSFNICIAGRDPFGRELDKGVRSFSIEGRPIRIVRMETVQAGVGCQILYVTATQAQSVAQAFDLVRNMPVLTVAEQGAAGAAVTFVVENDRVRFDIDTEVARSHGLVISSKLLSLARNVRPKRE